MAYSEGAYLAPPDFTKRFRAAWDAAQSRFLKVERRQSYNQAGDDSYEAFRRGDFETAAKLLEQGLLGQSVMYAAAQERGVELVRLRLVEQPLSDYLRHYEIPSYTVSEKLGERIVLSTVDRRSDDLPDCIVFDEEVMFVNAYDGLNRLVGAIEVRDGEQIAKHIALAERFLAAGTSLQAFVHANAIE
jgi:hypothetical protein